MVATLIGTAIEAPLGGLAVADVDRHERLAVAAGEDRGGFGQAGQEPRGDRVELAHVPERECPKERPQRRRRVRPGEDPAHPAVAQQVEVIDGVRTGEHPADDRGGLRRGVGRGHRQALEEVVEAGRSGQPQRRYQTCGRHQIRVIEHRSGSQRSRA